MGPQDKPRPARKGERLRVAIAPQPPVQAPAHMTLLRPGQREFLSISPNALLAGRRPGGGENDALDTTDDFAPQHHGELLSGHHGILLYDRHGERSGYASRPRRGREHAMWWWGDASPPAQAAGGEGRTDC